MWHVDADSGAQGQRPSAPTQRRVLVAAPPRTVNRAPSSRNFRPSGKPLPSNDDIPDPLLVQPSPSLPASSVPLRFAHPAAIHQRGYHPSDPHRLARLPSSPLPASPGSSSRHAAGVISDTSDGAYHNQHHHYQYDSRDASIHHHPNHQHHHRRVSSGGSFVTAIAPPPSVQVDSVLGVRSTATSQPDLDWLYGSSNLNSNSLFAYSGSSGALPASTEAQRWQSTTQPYLPAVFVCPASQPLMMSPRGPVAVARAAVMSGSRSNNVFGCPYSPRSCAVQNQSCSCHHSAATGGNNSDNTLDRFPRGASSLRHPNIGSPAQPSPLDSIPLFGLQPSSSESGGGYGNRSEREFNEPLVKSPTAGDMVLHPRPDPIHGDPFVGRGSDQQPIASAATLRHINSQSRRVRLASDDEDAPFLSESSMPRLGESPQRGRGTVREDESPCCPNEHQPALKRALRVATEPPDVMQSPEVFKSPSTVSRTKSSLRAMAGSALRRWRNSKVGVEKETSGHTLMLPRRFLARIFPTCDYYSASDSLHGRGLLSKLRAKANGSVGHGLRDGRGIVTEGVTGLAGTASMMSMESGVTSFSSNPKHNRARSWWKEPPLLWKVLIPLTLGVIGLVVIFLIIFYVVLPKHIQSVVNHAEMRLDVVRLLNIGLDSFDIEMGGVIAKDSNADVTIRVPEGVAVDHLAGTAKTERPRRGLGIFSSKHKSYGICNEPCWWDPDEMSHEAINIRRVGLMNMGALKSNGRQDVLSLSGRFDVTDHGAFAAFVGELFEVGSSVWRLDGRADVDVMGLSFRKFRLYRAMVLKGLPLAVPSDGPSLLKVRSMSLAVGERPGLPEPEKYYLAVTAAATLRNDGPIIIDDLGRLEFTLLFDGTAVAQLQAEHLPLELGANNVTLVGILDPDAPGFGGLLSSMLTNPRVPITIQGAPPNNLATALRAGVSSHASSDVGRLPADVTVFSDAMDRLHMETFFDAGSIPGGSIVQGFDVKRVQLDPIDPNGQDRRAARQVGQADVFIPGTIPNLPSSIGSALRESLFYNTEERSDRRVSRRDRRSSRKEERLPSQRAMRQRRRLAEEGRERLNDMLYDFVASKMTSKLLLDGSDSLMKDGALSFVVGSITEQAFGEFVDEQLELSKIPARNLDSAAAILQAAALAYRILGHKIAEEEKNATNPKDNMRQYPTEVEYQKDYSEDSISDIAADDTSISAVPSAPSSRKVRPVMLDIRELGSNLLEQRADTRSMLDVSGRVGFTKLPIIPVGQQSSVVPEFGSYGYSGPQEARRPSQLAQPSQQHEMQQPQKKSGMTPQQPQRFSDGNHRDLNAIPSSPQFTGSGKTETDLQQSQSPTLFETIGKVLSNGGEGSFLSRARDVATAVAAQWVAPVVQGIAGFRTTQDVETPTISPKTNDIMMLEEKDDGSTSIRSQHGLSIRFTSGLETVIADLTKVMKPIRLTGEGRTSIWHPFEHIDLRQVQLQADVEAATTNMICPLGQIQGTLWVINETAVGESTRDASSATPALALPKPMPMSIGIMDGRIETVDFAFDTTFLLAMNHGAQMVEFIQYMLVDGTVIVLSIPKSDVLAELTVDHKLPVKIRDKKFQHSIVFPHLDKLANITFTGAEVEGTDEEDNLHIKLTVEVETPAIIQIDLGPVMFDWMVEGEHMGPGTLERIYLNPLEKKVEWALHLGLFPTGGMLPFMMRLAAEFFSKETLIFCFGRRQEVTEEESRWLEEAGTSWTPIVNSTLNHIEEICARMPNPMARGSEAASGLLNTVSQLAFRVLQKMSHERRQLRRQRRLLG